MALAPIVVFAYNRPWHLKQTLEALSKNDLANQSDLFIFCDGPKNNISNNQLSLIIEVKKIAREKQWCKNVDIIESDYNKGLADSIVGGVSTIIEKYGRIIVLEDDIVTSEGFLSYMNAALDLYEDDEKVMHISGYMYPHKGHLGDTFFCSLPLCWGWATWSRAWNKFDGDAEKWRHYYEDNKLWDRFNVFGGRILQKQLEDNVCGRIHTWFVKWHSSVMYNNGLALFPGQSLVNNIGMDNSGEHCSQSDRFTNVFLAEHIKVSRIPIKENKKGRKTIKQFYQGHWYSKRNRIKFFNSMMKPFESIWKN